MIVTEIVGNLSNFPTEKRKLEKVWLDWFELDKKLLRKQTESGEEVGIRVEHPLKDGDVLFADENRVVAIDILPADLTVVSVHTMQEMGRLCFELGNRHLSLSIGEHEVKVPYDEPTFLYLEKLGFHPEQKKEKFVNYTVCHAHGHGHDHQHKHERD